eukprot:653736-Karenia_brevis.AAC.1
MKRATTPMTNTTMPMTRPTTMMKKDKKQKNQEISLRKNPTTSNQHIRQRRIMTEKKTGGHSNL